MSTKKETVKRCKSSIKQICSQLDRFYTFVTSCDESSNKVLINERLIKCESLWEEFNKLQLELDYLDESSDESFSVRDDFENKYFATMCIFKEITTANVLSNTNPINNASNNNSSAVKLPPLDLPFFDGKYDQWTSFFDTFSALIHSNNNLTNVQKFYYLQSCLKGEAAQAISSIAVTDLNYEIAFKLIKDRFENKRLIIQSHLKSLFDMPVVTKNNHNELRKCIDTIQKNVRALKALQEPVDYWDTILIYIFNLKLDIITKSEWETFSIKNSAIKYNDFISFLVQRCQVLESIHSATKPNFYERPFEKAKGTTRSMFASKHQCEICANGEHSISNCNKFLKLSPAERINDIKRLRLCLNCFKSNHLSIKCTQGGCKKCGKPHNTLLHLDFSKHNKNNNSNSPHAQSEQPSGVPVERTADNVKSSTSFNSCNINRIEENEVLLSTAMVLVEDKDGKTHEVRAMLDSGSQSNFISSNLVSLLKLSTNEVNMVVIGVNNSASKLTKSVDLEIKSKFCSFLINVKCFVLNKISDNLPTCLIKKEDLKIPSNIFLADSTFNIPGKIDIIIGANLFYDLLSVGQIRLAKNMPIFQKTKLGWVISGSVPLKCDKLCSEMDSDSECNTTMCNFVTNKMIQKQMEQFWAIEEIKTGKILKKEEKECEDLFINTTTHTDDGKFVVELPTRAGIEELGDSKEIAIHRFNKLERKLTSNNIMKEQYTNFMKEYESLGHMTLIPDDEIESKNITYYIPHHPVLKETSSTTKLRVVFDASAKTTKGISLNEKLKSGPVIQDELFSILIRFREHTYVIGADVEKMYRQVWIKQDQRDLQRIVWRDSAEESLRHYRLNTVTYGTTPASYLAIRSLHMAAEEQELFFPNASKEIKKNFYVDDLLTGTSSIKEAIKLKEEISEILKKTGFILRKWVSNERDILDKSEVEDIKYYIVEENITKTLGLVWNIQRDSLQYFVQIQNNVKWTKRNILSAISKLFDPLGLIGPIITTAKILMQGLWSENFGWDEEVPKELGESWMQFYQDLPILNECNIARHVLCSESVVVELHGFCDSSEKAYGACIYFRSENNSGEIQSHVVCAKSRVAPMKTLTLPRLELCGAVLLTRLMNKIVNSLNISINKICYWTDSKIVLAWIAVEAANWNVFVSHRVAEIQQATDINNWRHVSSEENPADLISRGCSPNKLINSELWWHGPHWLTKTTKHWPSAEINAFQDIEVPEKRLTKRAFISTQADQDIFCQFSNFYKLQRTVAYCLRFFKNINSLKKNKITGDLSVCELEQALICLINLAQAVVFEKEISALKLNKNISKNSKLNSLNPFLDKDDILRVGGRLNKALISYNQKHPIILDKGHILSKLIIESEHRRNLHLGPQNLLCHIRCKFWILGGINTIKKVLRSCIVCFRVKPRTFNTIMGELPEPRLVPTKPFFNSGVDYAGPFNIKSSSLRNAKILKAYLCIFVCFVTKAVHLEVVSDLTTASFLNALKRFIARRGKCQNIFSDCGTNFVGANQAMNAFFKFLNEREFSNKVTKYLAQDGIKWNFIPPRSPHFGGLWESHVKIAKTQLKKVVGNAALNFEELTTVFTQIEACMNSRPLSPLSSDPLDFSPLTPGHFLTGESLIAFPEQDVREIKCNRINRYQYLKQLVQHFWDRWYLEYLSELNRRLKWKFKGGDNIKVGDMVILKDDHVPPLKWPLGRVESVFPGTDNIVRVVLVKTAKGSFKRAVSKICVLPMET